MHLDIPEDEVIDMIIRRVNNNKEQYFKVKNNSDKTVMTIHSAKGREFDNVIMTVNGLMNFNDEEELRVLYVACTRTKNNLAIILPEDMMKGEERFRYPVLLPLMYYMGVI